ncbi:3-isopropylmalate dehydratase small subunit [Polymorphum gilvum]|uniref:3-isopropylmalate dehydratase small subunit n=1 Tax=Polymorphum gilvum (strain LMG 25793 / CGMCC 1.9160 / SL003B-26A1) TaxID=991905 RepID=F2J4K0_POLGS|nr:3-isopropylmalate dehydratase small subunit [Polymorphum gilvum]ADZ72252.1 3-isopropylmalate dehydratase, small subunit [Polymorphum gilvum SL003B-26A1]
MSGRIFLFGNDIDTDQLAPGLYMKGGIAELAAHCLEGVRPDFASSVRPGDIVVAGTNFGMGSSREQAAEALKHLGVAGVVALSFAGIFYRNAINLGLPVLVAHSIDGIGDGDVASLDIDAGLLNLPAKERTIRLERLPDNLKAMLADGGLVPHLKKRFAAERDKEHGRCA